MWRRPLKSLEAYPWDMRTLVPKRKEQPPPWTKECTCSGCGSLLLVEWPDLYLVGSWGQEPKEAVEHYYRRCKGQAAYYQNADSRVRNRARDIPKPEIRVVFCCHNCQVETDILRKDFTEVAESIFWNLPSKKERALQLQPFLKD